MKRSLFILALLSFVSLCYAESRVWVSPLEIKPGEHGNLRVNYQFDEGHTICNYQMKVNLPDGVTVDGTSVVLGSCHTSHTGSIVNNVLVVTSMNAVLQGTSGVLVEIPVMADNSLNVGAQLEGNLENVKLGQTDETSLNSTGITFDVEVVDYIVLDENSISAPVSTASAQKVKVKRTIKANEWSTICLPFTMSKEEALEVFGDDLIIGWFESYETIKEDDAVIGITINFEDEDFSEGFTANYPYVIKVSSDISEFTVNAILEPDEDIKQEYTTGSGKNKKTLGTFVGTYRSETIVPENSLFLSRNKFFYSSGKTKMQAFRGYFTFQDVLAELGNAASRIQMSFDDEISDISATLTGDGGLIINNTVFDLQGRRVTKPLNKGLYLRDGKKIFVK